MPDASTARLTAEVISSRPLSPADQGASLLLVRPLTRGERVVLPDGDVADVLEQRGDDVHVVHPNRTLGRGPWIFSRWLVKSVDELLEDEPTEVVRMPRRGRSSTVKIPRETMAAARLAGEAA